MFDFLNIGTYFAPDGRSFCFSVDGKVHVYDVETGQERTKFDAKQIDHAAISPDGRLLLSNAYGRGTIGKKGEVIQATHDDIVLYDIASGKEDGDRDCSSLECWGRCLRLRRQTIRRGRAREGSPDRDL